MQIGLGGPQHADNRVILATVQLYLQDIETTSSSFSLCPTKNKIILQQQFEPKIVMVGMGVDRRIILSWSTPNID